MKSDLELDQEDIGARLEADEYLGDVKVLVQLKGVIESDVDTALSTLNVQGGKIGACLIVLMPALLPGDSPNAEGPLFSERAAVQVIAEPLFNLSDSGTGKSAEAIMIRCSQILHHLNLGRGKIFNFDGVEPTDVKSGKVSYTLFLLRESGARQVPKSPAVFISSDSAAAPATVTMTCPGADKILYTVDGSYPSERNEFAREYTAPFDVDSCATIRAQSIKSGCQQSDIRQLLIT